MLPRNRGMLGEELGFDNEANLFMSLNHILTMQSDKPPNWAQQHEVEIQSLRAELQAKETEINDLQKQLQDVQQKNNDLQINLNTKDKEVRELKDRIQTLEEEKKDLQEELSRVENKLKRLEKEMKDLHKSSQFHEEQNKRLEENLQRVEYDLKSTESNLRKENEKLKTEVKQLKETQAARPLPEQIRPAIMPPREESIAKLHLGELCWQIQGRMYKKILPEHYTKLRSYKVKSIMKDVEKLVKDEAKRAEAKSRFESLKGKLNWEEDFEEAMKILQDTRNIEAHPTLDEAHLKGYAQILEKKGMLKGYVSIERVDQLINIWKQLSSITE